MSTSLKLCDGYLHSCLLHLKGADDFIHVWMGLPDDLLQLRVPPLNVIVGAAVTDIINIPD